MKALPMLQNCHGQHTLPPTLNSPAKSLDEASLLQAALPYITQPFKLLSSFDLLVSEFPSTLFVPFLCFFFLALLLVLTTWPVSVQAHPDAASIPHLTINLLITHTSGSQVLDFFSFTCC